MDTKDYDSLGNDIALQTAANQQTAQAQQTQATQYYLQEQEKNLAEAQLDVETTLKHLYYRLRQEVQTPQDDGTMKWVPLDDKTKRRLTDDGVERIMEIMSFYINKENLLSNFSEEQINRIMLTFRLAFSANILMRYKIYFRSPAFEECQAILEKKLDEKAKIKLYALNLANKEGTHKQIKKDLIKGIEDRIEYEIDKIKEGKLKENLSEFELLFEQLSQMVLATLNRAWKGEERGSLRRHTNIAEIIGSRSQVPKETGGLFKWGRR